MPKRAASISSVVEDSEEERKSKKSSPSKTKAKVESVPDSEEDGGGDDEGDDEEYEIEAIVKHQRGHFKPGEMAYYVKRKNYDDKDNTWVSEEDAAGAQDMIQEYWLQRKGHKDHPANKKARVSTGKLSKSSSKTKVDSDGEDELTKKRRLSKAASAAQIKAVADPDEDAGSVRPKKKQKTTAEVKTPSSSLDTDKLKAKLQAEAKLRAVTGEDGATQDPESDLGNMEPFKHMRSWNDLVQSIQTVEMAEDGRLRVYFVIKDKDEERRVVEDSSVCGLKFPAKMLQFYESHLRWRPADISS